MQLITPDKEDENNINPSTFFFRLKNKMHAMIKEIKFIQTNQKMLNEG